MQDRARKHTKLHQFPVRVQGYVCVWERDTKENEWIYVKGSLQGSHYPLKGTGMFLTVSMEIKGF